jgi:excisionase family DNA binding protein
MQLRDAAETLGVHYQTAYGWVRQGTLRARKTPRGYEVSEGDVLELMARRAAGAEPAREVQVRDWAAQSDRLYAALAAGDEAQARHDFARLAAGAPLFAVRVRQPPGRPRGVAVTTTPPGERHALPAMMAAACLREDHWQVQDLAADLPVAEVISLAADTGAGLIVLSSATVSAARLAAREARQIREALPEARVLTGRPGDTLSRLRQLARAPAAAGGHARTGG